jgi:hypothetical protein
MTVVLIVVVGVSVILLAIRRSGRGLLDLAGSMLILGGGLWLLPHVPEALVGAYVVALIIFYGLWSWFGPSGGRDIVRDWRHAR